MCMRNLVVVAYAWLSVLVFLLVGSAACSKERPMTPMSSKENIMQNESTYPTYYSSPRRDCAIAVASRAGGNIAWSRELGLERADILPALLIWEGNILAVAGEGMVLFSPDSRRLWDRVKRADSPPAVANGLLYFENRGHFLEAVDPNNSQVLKKAPFPGVPTDEFHVTLLWPREKDFIATIYLPDPTYDTEDLDTPPPQPEVLGRRTVYGELVGAWGKTYEGVQALPPLFVPELERWIISMDEVISVDLKLEEEASRFKIPLEQSVNWSADAEGTLCIIGYHEGHKVMLAMSLTGEEKWRWSDRKTPDRWVTGQPPIRSGNRRVYGLTGGRILAIEQGKLLWQYEVKNGTIRHGSSLADGSLLVAAGKTLILLNLAGKERFLVSLDNEILTPPVVDADGNIYVATATHLVQIK